MNLKMSMVLSTLLLGNMLYATNVNVTTKYGQTGGVLGSLNKTTDKINGREICSVNPTAGCDFDDDPKFNNNDTVDDPSDDSYNGDLLVRTNDNFQAIAGWTWNGTAGGAEEVATITGTLPAGGYYEWAALPGSCNLANSSISDDKQTIVCERKDFDKNDAGTYSEDLTFNVRVLGGTPNGTQPGDIKFKVEAVNATAVEDTTDGNSLTVTASPRWNLDKTFGAYTVRSGQTVTIDGEEKEGWVIDYRLLIETDEVNGETDNTYSLLGNESLGADATLTFTDDLSKVSPGAKLLDCRTTGRAYSDGGGTLRDGYDGSNLPITFSGEGSIKETQVDSHLPQAKGEQVATCTQTGSSVAVEVKHVDATLNHYPTRDYYNRPLPVNRAIASMVNMSIFIPLEDVKAGSNGTVDCDGYGIGRDDCDDGELITKNYVTDFNPVSASGVQNFSGQGESEKDNYRTYTLQYSAGSFDKYYWGDKNSIWNGPAESTSSRQGDRFVGKGYEWSSRLYASNSGGVDQTENSFCDVIDANYMEIIKYGEKTNYTDTRYNHEDELPFITYTSIGKGDPDNHLYNGSNLTDYYDFEFAGDYEDASFLPSNNNNRQDENQDAKTRAECDAPANKWYATMDEARNAAGGVGAVTKVRWKLKPNMLMVPGQNEYWMLLHRVRENRLDNNEPLQPGDMMVNYGKHKFDGNQGTWSNTSYIPHGLDANGIPEGFSGGAGDRMFYTDAKVRIQKEESRTSATPGNKVTYSFKMSFTDDIRTQGESDSVKLTDVLPKDFKYQKGSVSPSSYDEPTIGSCADALDINSTESPCVNGENQVLIWNLGNREINADIADLNYTALIGAAAKVGTNTNVVKIESPADASPISQRKSEIGLTIDVPASINIVKNTEENPDYPSKRERTTEPKDIFFNMDMRNGKDGEITDLDVIDILPFEGDGDDASIKFNNLELKRKKATSFKGSMIFHEASFNQHPGSSTTCDTASTRGGDYSVKYYYTNADPKIINMAPTVGDANDVTDATNSIWCEGDASGPNGCTIESSGFTFTDNSQVTAVRARGPRMEKQAICQFKVHVTVDDNLAGDNYSNSAGASATGITLPVLSNSLAVPVVGSSLGDRVWYDKNANGIQDEGENGIEGVTVKLLDGSGNPVKNPLTGVDYVTTTGADGIYGFNKLNQGNYIVEIVPPAGYIVSKKEEGGNSAIDSDLNSDSNRTDVITLDVEEDNPTIDMGIFTPIISGNLFSDGNGDNTINGTKISTASGTQLYVTLLSNSGDIIATKALLADGSYEFDGEDGVEANSDYKVVISSDLNTTTSTLPDNWNHADGEHIGTGAGTDGTADGIIDIKVLKENVPNVNFGINEKPVAHDKTEAPQLNPGADVKVSVPDLNVTDREDGTPTTITITTLSNGKLYYNGNLVTLNEAITNADPSKFTVDPDNSDQTVVFNYTTTDKVGVVSDEATVTMPFRGLKISGNIFDDGSGDTTINGTKISNPDSKQLYATLLSGDGAVLATKAISAGAYSFDGDDGIKPNSSYTVVLSTEANATEAKLPADWNNADGEHIGTTEGTDGDADGSIVVSVEGVDVPEVNFGINNKPTVVDKAEPTQANPGKDNQVNVPALEVSDDEDGTPTTITITTVPTNGKLYYDGDEIKSGDTITDFDPSKFTVDPDNGDQTVVFNYTTTDKAGVVSDEAKVTLPFTDIAISGKLFDDGNNNGNVDGNVTSKADNTQLYVTLVDANGNAVASKPLGADGTYSFSNVDGVIPNTNYSIVLSDVENGTIAKLPENWNNADGENIGLIGLDRDADGIVTVNVASTHIPEINFGINKKPEAVDKAGLTQANPGTDVQVVVSSLSVSDKEDGTPTTIIITTVPTNGKLYYDGIEVSAGEVLTNFDPSKFTVDPDNGDQTVVFNYTTTDKVGVVSDEAKVTLPFTDIAISGKLFDDGNNNGNVDGNVTSKADNTQLYVTLVDANGNAVASKPLGADGTYSFSNVDGVIPNTNYSIVLSDVENGTIAKLPENWNNADGENIGLIGLDGDANGIVIVNLAETQIVEINFGINEKPVAYDKTEPSQLNPGADVQVAVPDLNVTDREDGIPTTITITILPTNGKLYYNGNLVIVNEAIENADPSKFTVDPDHGDQTVVFKYTTTDKVGVVSNRATVTLPFVGLKISGNVYDDGSGDTTVDGTKFNNPSGTILYVTLIDASGTVLATTAIAEDGSYLFEGEDGTKPNTTYSVVLSTEANTTIANLPTGWNHADGEHIGTGEGLDGSADGKIIVPIVEVNVPEINFGINKKPEAVDKAGLTQANPGTDVQVVVPSFSVSDKEDGTPTTITITTVPTNGKLYYDGIEVSAGEVLTNFDPSKFTVDPDHGDQTLEFKYTATDKAGVVSDEAKVTLPFTDIAISGKLFDDGNNNGNVDGNLTSKADDTQLYVTLVDANGDAVASKPLGVDGTYSFSNVDGVTPNTNYTMVLSDEANKTTPKLPENWNNADGENIGLDGVDRDADGIVTVNVASTHILEINFGINKKPVAVDKTEPTQFNPGSDVQVSVPTLEVSDKEDGTPATVTIRTLPTNATLYYDGAEVTVDMEIADLTLLTVDPDDGDQTVLFTYTSTDVTGMVSNPATVTMPFKGIKISGNIFNDGNADGIVNGTPIASPNGTQLHATLLDVNGTAIATTPIAEDGTYSFGNKDGVLPNHSYSVVLSTTANSNEASLPVNWNNADGEHIGTNKGLDDAPDGVIAVAVVETDVVEVNFGINKKPVAGDNTGDVQLNPGTDVQVNVIDLNVSDSEDTTPSTVTIKTVPSNGTLYYDGKEVVANQVIENFDNSKLTLDPNNGTLTVSFTYTTTDGSGVESDVATIAMPFKGLKISGNIFNDGNNNGTVDGKLTSKADELALYAVLLDSNGNFMAREAIKADGSYDFDGLDGIVPNSTYNVVLTSDANGTTAMLPNTWTNADGEHIGADAGLDGTADGAIEVAVTIVDVPEVNFGINKRPIADDKTEPEQLNTSRDAQYVVPTLTVSDNEDASPVITIRTLPTNGTLYYEGTPVELNATIADPSKLIIDPDDGDQNVTFTYTSTDVTGAISDPATVVMPFVGVKISGYIFADGNNDKTVNGTQIATVDGVQLYATLINDNNETLATVAIDSNGSYLFENKDGVYPNNNYHVVLSTEANATTASLPENWNHADGEHIGRDKGLDDSANGVIDVSVVTTDIPEVNFGINKRPVVKDVTSVVQANPGADKQIKVIDLGIIDNEDGSPKTVTIVSLPTDGTLYYDGVAVEKGQIIPNFNNKLLTVDPKNGATKIEFDYTTTDNTGWESEKARATMPFAAVAPAENFTAEDDAQPASLEGPVTTINVLENDILGEGSTIHLLDTNNGSILWNDGTAVGSATINTQDSVVVPGEGVWTVRGNTVVFTAEEGFTGIPTPIYYVVEDNQGNQTNAAQVAIISNCVCDTYENSVSALNPWWMLVGMFFISILGALFARREFEEVK